MNKSKKYYMKGTNGITLIALVVTIIILLILAGVSINLVLGENGLIQKAKYAKVLQTEAEAKEKVEMLLAEYAMEKQSKNTTLLVFLQNKFDSQEIDGVIDNEDGTYTIELDDFEVTFKSSNMEIIDVGKINGVKPIVQLSKNTEEIVEKVEIQVDASITEGEIELIIKPDGTTTTETNFVYEVTENKVYVFVVKATNGRRTTASIEINNVKETIKIPEIETSANKYAIITPTGIKLEGSVTINFDNKTGLENYYSIDDGESWNLYTEPFEVDDGTTEIRAKTVKNGIVLAEQSKIIEMATDALKTDAFDDDETTGDELCGKTKRTEAYINVKENSNIRKMKMRFSNSSYTTLTIYFLDSNGDEIEPRITKGGAFNGTLDIEIPVNTVRIKFGYGTSSLTAKISIYELILDDTPDIICEEQEYPIITSTNFIPGYNIVSINYFSTSIQKLYKIDDGEWLIYDGQKIKIYEGQTIYAKGIKEDSKETINVAEYKTTLPTNALSKNAFDDDETTGDELCGKTKRTEVCIKVEENSNLEKLYLKQTNSQYTKLNIKFFDKNEEELLPGKQVGSTGEIEIPIPANTAIIKFTYETTSLTAKIILEKLYR